MSGRQSRLMFAVTVATAWLLALVVRLYGLQVLEHERYAQRAVDQQQSVIELSAPRSAILDARGRELAVSLEVESIYADPRALREQGGDPAAIASRLAALLGQGAADRRRLAEKLSSERGFVWVARKPDLAVAQSVLAEALPGIYGVAESRRFYPMRTLAAHVLGFVGVDDIGLGGVEAMFDSAVRSQPGRRVVVSDGLAGRALHPRFGFTAPRAGDSLELTLDSTVQHILEYELTQAVAAHAAKSATGVVMDPRSGAVLAMAGVPTFDPNRFGEYPPSRWRNPVIADVFEPGSTFKIVTLAAALERNRVALETVFDCEMGALVLHGRTIRDHKPFGLLSVRQVMAKSSNVGAMKLGIGAGSKALYGAMRAFGIGRKTGIDLPGESAGLLRSLDDWHALTPAYMSFGQGLATTTLQMAVAFAIVANGGYSVEPHVVARRGGRTVPRRPGRLLLRAETVSTLRSALESVVLEGTGEAAQVVGYRVAGKTGTAQIAERGSYAADRYVASFIGFLPADDPELLVAIVIDEPWPAYHGSEAAAPAFAAVAERSMAYLGVAPRRQPPLVWPGERRALVARLSDPARPAFEPPRRAAVPPGSVPDLVGLTKRQALLAVSGLGLELSLSGGGYVVRQVPPAGTPVELSGGLLELWLEMAPPIAGDHRGMDRRRVNHPGNALARAEGP